MRLEHLPVALLALLALTCQNVPPRNPQTPSGPESARTDVSYEYSTWTHDQDEGDRVAVRFDWGDGTQTDWSELNESGATFAAEHAWPNTGRYIVAAQARDQHGSASDWSDSLEVLVSDDANNAPGVPVLLAPADSAYVGTEQTFLVCATDPEGDSLQFAFAWQDGDTSDWSDWMHGNETLAVAARVLGHHRPTAARVRARDYGYTSGWSEWTDVPVFREGTVKWAIDAHGFDEEDRYPAIGMDGTVYAPTYHGLAALDPTNGQTKWSAGYCALSSPVVGPDGTIYYAVWLVFEGPRLICALDPDGLARWRFEPDLRTERLALAADGALLAANYSGDVAAYRQDTLRAWHTRGGGSNYTPTAIGRDGAVFARLDHDRIFGLNPADGSTMWTSIEYSMNQFMEMAIGADGTIYLPGSHPGSGAGSLVALDPSDGSEKWSFDCGSGVGIGAAVGPDGTVYIPSRDHVTALDHFGNLRWRYAVEDDNDCNSTIALAEDGTIICGLEHGLLALSPEGTVKWRNTLRFGDQVFPVIGRDGTIYVASEDSLYAVDGSAPLANSPWPKFQHDYGNTGQAGP